MKPQNLMISKPRTLMTLIALLFCLSARADVGMLDAAAWISLEEVDTIVAPLVHAPLAKKALAGRKVGEYTMPVFLREFKARKNVYRATLYVCGLGHFNVYLDGQKVGDHFLDPGWTLYDKEALYVKFDVTRWFKEDASNVLAEFAQRIKRGEHELRVELGGGFYDDLGGAFLFVFVAAGILTCVRLLQKLNAPVPISFTPEPRSAVARYSHDVKQESGIFSSLSGIDIFFNDFAA